MEIRNLHLQKKVLSILLVLLLSVAGMTKGFAQANYDFSAVCETGQTLYYKITDADNRFVTLTSPVEAEFEWDYGYGNDVSLIVNNDPWSGFVRPTGNIILPEYVTIDNVTYSVTGIDYCVFYGCSNLTGSLTIPNSVTEILDGAFHGCSGFMGSLTIPNSVTLIWHFAFSGCSGFTGSLTFPNSITKIGANAFSGCSGFTGSLTIPNSMTELDWNTFSGCSGFTGSLTIPNSVIYIWDGAFSGCNGFTGSLTIPNSVGYIGTEAFSGCSSFTGTLTIPNSVGYIGYGAFKNCSGFSEVQYNAGIDYPVFGDGSFSQVNYIWHDWHDSNAPFSNCSGTLTIGDNVENIPDYMFADASFTGSLVIPNSVTYLGSGAFKNCSGFSEVQYNVGWDTPVFGDYSIFEYDWQDSNAPFCNCSGTLTIGDNVEYIPDYMFAYASFTGSLVIPNSVTYIGENAFMFCSGFTGSLTIGNSVSFIALGAFYYCAFTSMSVLRETPPTLELEEGLGCPPFGWIDYPVYVPCGSVSSYQSAQGWDLFTNYQEIGCDTYNISVVANPMDGGTLTGGGEYDSSADVTLVATANPNYVFVNWTENGEVVSTNPTYSFTATADRDLVANFMETSSTNHWTTITGTQYNLTMSGIIYIDGVTQTSTALEIGAFCGNECRGSARAQFFPPTGEHVVSLTVVSNQLNGETIIFRLYDHDTQQEFPSECINSITFVANNNIGGMGDWYPFAFNNTVAITAAVTPEGAGTVDGTGDYMPGSACTLTATANIGYAFRSWSVNGETVSTDNPYTFTVNNAVEVTANFDSQEATMLAEGWTWWSTSIEMSGIDGLTMLEESLGHNGLLIKSVNKFVQNYYPNTGYDYWFGQLTSDDFNNESSYMIQTSTSCEVIMTGTYANPSDHPIQLYPNWTWIGYPCGIQQSAASAFAGFTPTHNDLVKGQYAFSTYYDNYGWFPEFSLTPGQGYMYQSLASDNRTLTFANGSKADPVPANGEDRYWRNNVHAYADNMNVIAVVTVSGEEQHGEDIELGAFVNGECRGSAMLKHFQPTDRWYAMLTVTGADGDEIEFGVIDRNRGMASMTSDRSLVFQTNTVVGKLDEPYVIDFGTLGCIENDMEEPMHIYPNPIERNTRFTIALPETETLSDIFIVNMMGEVVAYETNKDKMTALQTPGVYTVKVVCLSGKVFVGKLVVR